MRVKRATFRPTSLTRNSESASLRGPSQSSVGWPGLKLYAHTPVVCVAGGRTCKPSYPSKIEIICARLRA